jgi:hypothetical protein
MLSSSKCSGWRDAAAAKLNAGIRWRSGIPVHGLLTDLTHHRFYSFNPVTQEFALDEELMTIGRREDLAAEMIQGQPLS